MKLKENLLFSELRKGDKLYLSKTNDWIEKCILIKIFKNKILIHNTYSDMFYTIDEDTYNSKYDSNEKRAKLNNLNYRFHMISSSFNIGYKPTKEEFVEILYKQFENILKEK